MNFIGRWWTSKRTNRMGIGTILSTIVIIAGIYAIIIIIRIGNACNWRC